jgi:hypothetical protein
MKTGFVFAATLFAGLCAKEVDGRWRGGGREVWVCDYYPPGNWVDERPY